MRSLHVVVLDKLGEYRSEMLLVDRTLSISATPLTTEYAAQPGRRALRARKPAAPENRVKESPDLVQGLGDE
jgi:hypothetical protein